MGKFIDKLMTKAAEKLFQHVTDAKVRALYARAEHDPKLKKQLQHIEDQTEEMKRNLRKMADLLKADDDD